MIRSWPTGLAGRLILPLLLALILVQAGLIWVLSDEPGDVAETMIHGQTLTSVVTLARLLADTPADAAERLTMAFHSRQSCAWLVETAPSPDTAPLSNAPMSAAEQMLATTLGAMLHGVTAGPPRVSIRSVTGLDHPCHPSDHPQTERPPLEIDSVVAVSLPLPGRWLEFRTAVDVPHRWTGRVLVSALISILVTLGIIVLVVRRQTRWFQHLTQAAEQVGRGGDIAHPSGTPPREVATLLAAFATMQARLQRFMADRIRLLAAISHDLRTPLTTLRLKAEFIDDPTTRDGIITTIDEMTIITEASLAFTRAETSDEPIETIDLITLVQAVVEPLRFTGAAITGPTGDPIPYRGRPVALKRAVRNLVENALRYGQHAGITIILHNDRCVICIEDDGPGIPDHQIDDAFQPFVRLEASRNAATGGLGLGLAIARGIIQAHGGTVSLSNRATGGLRAEISLPA